MMTLLIKKNICGKFYWNPSTSTDDAKTQRISQPIVSSGG